MICTKHAYTDPCPRCENAAMHDAHVRRWVIGDDTRFVWSIDRDYAVTWTEDITLAQRWRRRRDADTLARYITLGPRRSRGTPVTVHDASKVPPAASAAVEWWHTPERTRRDPRQTQLNLTKTQPANVTQPGGLW